MPPQHPATTDDTERTSLINEIQRLEKSMRGALLASRDEIERLERQSNEKEQLIQKLEKELEELTKSGDRRSSFGVGGGGGSGKSGNVGSGSSIISGISSRGGGGSSVVSGFRRRITMTTGDRPFFRRPEEGGRPNLASLGKASSFRNLGLGGNTALSGGGDKDSDSEDQSDSSSDNEDDGTELSDSPDNDMVAHYKSVYESKKQDVARLQERQSSNEKDLIRIQKSIRFHEAQNDERWENHSATMEALQSRKEEISRKVARREKYVADSELMLEQYQTETIPKLEKEIEEKKENLDKSQSTKNKDMENVYSALSKEVEEVEDEIRQYHVKLRIHSQYTAKALDSFLHGIDTATKNARNSVIDKDDISEVGGSSARKGHESLEDDDDERLIEEVAMEVDIQLNNLERMIKSIEGRVDDFAILTSVHDPDADNDETQSSPSQLLQLTKECADVLTDFTSNASKIVHSSIQRSSSSGEISPSTQDTHFRARTCISGNYKPHDGLGQSSLDAIDTSSLKAEILNKKQQLLDMLKIQIKSETNIQLFKDKISKCRNSSESKKRSNDEIFTTLQSKFNALTERLNEKEDEIERLVREHGLWKRKEDDSIDQFQNKSMR